MVDERGSTSDRYRLAEPLNQPTPVANGALNLGILLVSNLCASVQCVSVCLTFGFARSLPTHYRNIYEYHIMQSPSVDHVPEHATLGVHTYLPTSGMSVRRYVPDCREVWEGKQTAGVLCSAPRDFLLPRSQIYARYVEC